MCLLAVCEERKMTESEVRSSDSSNPHGIGIAWLAGDGKVRFKKGLELEEFLDFYEDFEFVPHVVHFRFRSAGERIPELTHPFLMTETSPLLLEYTGKASVLFHNGTVSNWEDKLVQWSIGTGKKVPGQPMSDTRAVAVICSTASANLLTYLSGKWAVVTPSGIDVINKSMFTSDKGVLFSNGSYKSYGDSKNECSPSSVWHGTATKQEKKSKMDKNDHDLRKLAQATFGDKVLVTDKNGTHVRKKTDEEVYVPTDTEIQEAWEAWYATQKGKQ